MVTETKKSKSTMNLVTDSVLYNVVEKKNNLDKNKAVKYYAQVKKAGLMTEESLENQLEKMSTLTIGDVKNVLSNAQSVILDALRKGNVVQFGSIGTFGVGVRSKGTDTVKEFNATKINHVHVNFRASNAMREMMAKIKFTKLGESVTGGSSTGGSTSGGSTTGGNGGSSTGGNGGSSTGGNGGSTTGGSTTGGSTTGGSTGGSSDGGGSLKPNK
jgi:predicted histone-like DNA-binding protein